MARTERALLYAVAVVLAWLLFFGEREKGTTPVEPLPDGPTAPPMPSEIRLADASGRARIHVGLDERGQPAVTLSNADGSTELSLFVEDGGAAGVRLRDAQGRRATLQLFGQQTALSLLAGEKARIELSAQTDGSADLSLAGPQGEPVVKLRRGRDGRSELRLQSGTENVAATLLAERSGATALALDGAKGGKMRLAALPTGEAEIDVHSTTSGVHAFVRTDGAGAGEIALRAKDGLRGASMVLLPTGALGIAAKGPDGKTGPMLQLSADGTAELSATGPDGRSGPALMRLPDGVATIFVRGEEGSYGPSLLLLPDGSAQLGVAAKTGKGQALFRIEPDGRASMVILDTKGTPAATIPAVKR